MVREKSGGARGSQNFTAVEKSALDRGAGGALRWDKITPFADAGFRAVFDSSGEALLVVDATGVIQKANQRARDVLKMREANVTRSSLDGFVATLSTEKLTRMGIEGAPLAPASIDALLASGSPVRVTLRAVLPGSGDTLLCVDGNSDREPTDRAEAEPRAAADSEAVVFSRAMGPSAMRARALPKFWDWTRARRSTSLPPTIGNV